MCSSLYKKLFLLQFILAVILRLFFFFADYHEVWWDSGVYIGMGKYLFSGGQVGLWEDIRPVLWPLVLGFGWRIGFDPDFFGRIITFGLSLGCIFLLYLIAKRVFDEYTALVAVTIFAFSPIFFSLGFHTYTEIPSLFLLLLSILLLFKERIFLAGFVLGLSTLTRFPMGIFIIPFCVFLFFSKKIGSHLSSFLSAFVLSLTPFFVFNYVLYGNILTPFLAGSAAIKQVLGCNVLRYNAGSAYLYWLVFAEHPLHVFALIGIAAQVRRWFVREQLFLFSCVVIPLLYYSSLQCRDYRYLLSFLPFVVLFTAQGITFVLERVTETCSVFHKKHVFIAIFIFVLGTSLWQGLLYYQGNENVQKDSVALDYFSHLRNKNISGELWTANPLTAAYTDKYFEKIYYPVYHQQQYKIFFDYLQNSTHRVGAVLLDNCGGGILCHPDDVVCKNKTEEALFFLTKNFEIVYNKTNGLCYYVIFTRQNSTVSKAN